MKRIITTSLIVCALGLTGCKKYLEHISDSTITNLDTPEKVAELIGTAYPQANFATFTEAMSDNAADKGKGTVARENMDPYFFDVVQSTSEDSPENYWNAAYAAIAAANQALEAISQKPVKDSALYSASKGEALVARAYAHFMLVTFFCNFYDKDHADTDPGIPYVTVPETVVNKQYERKTVAYVYDMIRQDLLAGMPLIKDDYKVLHFHFNKAATYAFAARYYLYRQQYDSVLTYTNLAFPDATITANLRPWNTTYYLMTPSELELTYAKADENANLLLTEGVSVYARSYASYRYAMDYDKEREVLSSNVTGGDWVYPLLTLGGEPNFIIAKINEYFVKSSVNANIGYPYVMQQQFTVEEVLFNRAEANAYLGNFTAAITDLNRYASTRISNYSASSHTLTATSINKYYGGSNTQANVIQTILDFKRAEYVQEGQRWFDIMRHHLPITHSSYDGTRVETITDARDVRRVFQIPQSATSSGIALNPR